MRPLYIIGGSIAVLALSGVLAWTQLAPAQVPAPTPPVVPGEIMTITVAEVEVRSGPSDKYYPTSKLRLGSMVKVVNKSEKNNPGWLAIEPPPGSRSWIEATFVQKKGPNTGIVYLFTNEKTPVPIKPASSLTDDEPNVESFKLPEGTQIVILGPEYKDKKTGTSWLPIEPPAGDLRYIPESAVAKQSAVQPASVHATTTGFVVPPGGDQSVLAEADATLLKAKQLYEQAAKSSDPNQRQLALSRLQTIQLIPVSPAAAKQVGSPTTGAPVGPPSVTLSATGIPAQTTGGNAALYAAPTATGPAQWSKWGTLRRTQFNINGQATYRLEDQRGASLGYAVAAPGLTLEPYVGRLVCLYGPTAYRSDGAMRSDYTIAYQLDWRDR